MHQATSGNTKACLYRTRKTGKANITRRRGVGRNLYIVYITPDRAWAMTKKGDWIKTSKLTKGKKK